MVEQDDLVVRSLGPAALASPRGAASKGRFVDDATRVLFEDEVGPNAGPQLFFEKAGPRQKIFFDPGNTTAAIVTCGGLCPGLNNVIRSAYLELNQNYGVERVLGIRNGYAGLNPDNGLTPVPIDREFVSSIHKFGGTVLGSSRGPQDPGTMVDFLERHDVDILFCVGGDGTQRGARALADEVSRRGVARSIVGIPKTIDNDIPFVWMSFGYATAIEKAEEALRGANIEATGAPNGVGLVKLMGRDSGFIAAGAALASQEASFVLVPEVPFELDGDEGFLAHLERRVRDRGHALVVVAEGAGQELFEREEERRDKSGNLLHEDIGDLLKRRIKEHFIARDLEVNLKYIDPSYIIRSVPANAWDRILSDKMARAAVHAGMAGKTGVLIGFHHQTLIHVPIAAATQERRRMDLESPIWTGVMSSTGQPHW